MINTIRLQISTQTSNIGRQNIIHRSQLENAEDCDISDSIQLIQLENIAF